MQARSTRYQEYKSGISWKMMRLKCLHWGNQFGFDKFNSLDGWICDEMKRNGLIQVHIHGEGNDLIHNQEQYIMNPRLKCFHKGFLYEKNINPNCLYNAYQTRLYYHNLPNTLYIN